MLLTRRECGTGRPGTSQGPLILPSRCRFKQQPEHSEQTWESLRIVIKEVLRRTAGTAGGELVTEPQDLVHCLARHHLAKPGPRKFKEDFPLKRIQQYSLG